MLKSWIIIYRRGHTTHTITLFSPSIPLLLSLAEETAFVGVTSCSFCVGCAPVYMCALFPRASVCGLRLQGCFFKSSSLVDLLGLQTALSSTAGSGRTLPLMEQNKRASSEQLLFAINYPSPANLSMKKLYDFFFHFTKKKSFTSMPEEPCDHQNMLTTGLFV